MRSARGRSTGRVEFWVADTGVGIHPDQLGRMFQRFYKTDPSRTSAGTGLGLAICKHLVLAHRGTIRAESAGAGHGAIFSFRLPRETEPARVDGATAARAGP